MRILRWDASDPAATAACYDVAAAASAADDPLGPPVTARRMRSRFEHPVEPGEIWYVPGDTAGSAQGWYRLELPARENLDRGALGVTVHPSCRRRGIGTALLGHAASRAALDGRSILGSWVLHGSAGEAFARRWEATPGLLDARRVLVLASIPAGQIASLRTQAARAAAGYSLVSWYGRTPDEHLAGFAEVLNAANDMPRDPGEEDEIWDAQRVREQIDDVRELRGRHVYTIAALHDATGEMAAITDVDIDPETLGWGQQLLTAVVREHRGHRLGLLVKAAMLDWLAVAEPKLERIVTGNAATNRYMIAINTELGYELLNPMAQHYELAVADVLARGAAEWGAAERGAAD
jgi:GNAT superfamily N-acetyltransferase/RimJ/RimL family protein N-acetyltransferase